MPASSTIRQPEFPRTRYQGSKRRIAAAILARLADLEFTIVLDAFGGTGAMSYAFKRAGKHVTYNDVLQFNAEIGRALIENDHVRLSSEEIAAVGVRRRGVAYPSFIERTFDGIYFTRAENRWLDTAVRNIRSLPCPYKRALAWFSVFQAAMAKRPYNLFHRSNLYMRTADVPRSFGNKTTWDRSFTDHVRAFAAEANAAVVDGGHTCRAVRGDALDVDGEYDLVYIDPPYMNRAGRGVDYRGFYHFLEGMVAYDRWPACVDPTTRHRRLIARNDPWSDRTCIPEMFDRLFRRFRRSIIAVSYRSNGFPSVRQIAAWLSRYKSCVRTSRIGPRQYALSTDARSHETLIVGWSERHRLSPPSVPVP